MTAWAFVVGINDYPADTTLRKLHGAVADAAEFADWALHPDGGGVAPGDLYFWTYPAPATPSKRLKQFLDDPTPWPQFKPDFSRAPTTGELITSIGLIAPRALRAGAERLYVFFAGHGFQTKQTSLSEDPQTCFVGGDYHPDVAAAGLIPCDDMYRMLVQQGPPEIVLFLDACRNDASARVARPNGLWNISNPSGKHRRAAVGRAAQYQHVAWEVPHNAPVRGAFSTLLVSGLRGHRVNGQLTLESLEEYVAAGIANLVSPQTQYPDFEERPKPRQMVLAAGPPLDIDASVVISFGQGSVGKAFLLVGGPQDIRMPIVGSATPQSLPLPPGAYILETDTDQELKKFIHLAQEATNVDI
jgi:hypothetical protein